MIRRKSKIVSAYLLAIYLLAVNIVLKAISRMPHRLQHKLIFKPIITNTFLLATNLIQHTIISEIKHSVIDTYKYHLFPQLDNNHSNSSKNLQGYKLCKYLMVLGSILSFQKCTLTFIISKKCLVHLKASSLINNDKHHLFLKLKS